jgi:acetyl esterase/lipase
MTFPDRTKSRVFGRFGDRVEVFCYLCFVIGFNRRLLLCLIGLLAALTMVSGCGTAHKIPSGTVQEKMSTPEPIVTEYPNGFRPDLIVHLYPEGQRVDKGIIEPGTIDNQEIASINKGASRKTQRSGKVRKVKVTQGPGAANQTDTTEFFWPRDGSLNAVGDSARIVIYFPRPGTPIGPNDPTTEASHRPNDPTVSKAVTNGPTVPINQGQMILICPGGGYNELMFRSEGTYAAQVLTAKGYTVGIICYRMPTGNGEIPLTDVQNAFRYCRHHAKEWQISQIGIMGMSAGGHLAAMASTQYVDAITRPDFTILFYPVVSADPGLIHRGSFRKLTGLAPDQIKEASEALAKREEKVSSVLAVACSTLAYYSPDRHITPDTPPALLFHSIDDGVNPENSLRYYERLIAAGVPAELHIFPSGGHGWGFNTKETAGRDKLEPYRPVFYAALFSFLASLR